MALTHRLYVGGLDESVSEQDLRLRFASFGTVRDVHRARGGAVPRPFAIIVLETADDARIRQCFSLLNGSRWKGQQMKIERAKMPYYAEKRAIEREQSMVVSKKRKRSLLRAAADSSVVTPANATARMRWELDMVSRPVTTLRVQRPGGSIEEIKPNENTRITEFEEWSDSIERPRPVNTAVTDTLIVERDMFSRVLDSMFPSAEKPSIPTVEAQQHMSSRGWRTTQRYDPEEASEKARALELPRSAPQSTFVAEEQFQEVFAKGGEASAGDVAFRFFDDDSEEEDNELEPAVANRTLASDGIGKADDLIADLCAQLFFAEIREGEETRAFMRQGSEAEVREQWLALRRELTDSFKRKAKSAQRRKARTQTRSGGGNVV